MTPMEILDRLLSRVADCLTRDSAERLIELQIEPEIQARIDRLSLGWYEDKLSPEERAEYESYSLGTGIIAILQDKARARLASGAAR